jgi:uncharacterized protein
MSTKSTPTTTRHSLRYSRVPGQFAVCRLPAGSHVPDWALSGNFFSVTRSSDELSVVCDAASVPASIKHEADWVCLKLEGPFPFTQTGVLVSFIQPLSDRAIPIFAISTFDTDFVFVKQPSLEKTLETLRDAGHHAV